MSATAQSSGSGPTGILHETSEAPFDHDHDDAPGSGLATLRAHRHERSHRAPRSRTREALLSEQSPATLLGHIARLEASMGAALALLRRCIVEREAPTREALAAEAGFALGMSREAALAELDAVAQIVGVSSLR